MIELEYIDTQRVQDVRNGKINDRGCGKTTSKMLELLEFVQHHNDGNKYLFIGENYKHTRDISDMFNRWTVYNGFSCNYSHIEMKHRVTFRPSRIQTTFFDKIKSYFQRSRSPFKQESIFFRFVPITQINDNTFRGLEFNKVIVDLTYEASRKYIDELAFALLSRK